MPIRPRSRATLAIAIAAALLAGACARPRGPIVRPDMPEQERIDLAHRYAAEAARAEDPDEAIHKYRQAAEAYREFPAVWNNLGLLLMGQSRLLEADQAFALSAELSPADPRPVYNRGLIWFSVGYVDEARQYFAAALDRDPNYLPALRGSIKADRLLNRGDETTLLRLRRALLLETDERWSIWFRMQRLRVEQLVEQSRALRF